MFVMLCIKGWHYGHVVEDEHKKIYPVINNLTLTGYKDFGYFQLQPTKVFEGEYIICRRVVLKSEIMY